MAFYKSITCELKVSHSINADCSGDGRYVTPSMIVTTKCEDAYFVQGSRIARCGDNSSTCQPCACSQEGSVNSSCEEMTGKCTCKPGYFGLKCERVECIKGEWGSWTR